MFTTTNSNHTFAAVATYRDSAFTSAQPEDRTRIAILGVDHDTDHFGKVRGKLLVDITLSSIACTDNYAQIAATLIEELFEDYDLGYGLHSKDAEKYLHCEDPRVESTQTIILAPRHYMTWVEFVGSAIPAVKETDEELDYASWIEQTYDVHAA